MKKIMKSSRILDTGCAPYLARETGREVHGDDKASTKNKSSGISRCVTAKEIEKNLELAVLQTKNGIHPATKGGTE